MVAGRAGRFAKACELDGRTPTPAGRVLQTSICLANWIVRQIPRHLWHHIRFIDIEGVEPYEDNWDLLKT
jgi:hypothetical protein